MLALISAACDYGAREQRTALGPPLHLVATYPADGAGIDCSSSEPECGVPIDAPLELRFDRFLLPTTAVRQSIVYYTGRGRTPALLDPVLPELTPTYDPLERVVSFRLPEGAALQPNTLYTVEFPVAGAQATPPRDVAVIGWGFRAFDGAPLDEQGILRISFRTGEHRRALAVPRVPTCDEIVSMLRCDDPPCPSPQEGEPLSVGCTACHFYPDDAPLGLMLGDRDALRHTAIGKVAHQTETGPTTGVTLESPERFGSGMPIIDPLRPENSYLIYKMLVGSTVYGPRPNEPTEEPDCASVYSVALPPGATGPGCLEPPPEELERLRSWFVLGEKMPPERANPYYFRSDVRDLMSFIRAGADCP